jgi:hypothetical protein
MVNTIIQFAVSVTNKKTKVAENKNSAIFGPGAFGRVADLRMCLRSH